MRIEMREDVSLDERLESIIHPFHMTSTASLQCVQKDRNYYPIFSQILSVILFKISIMSLVIAYITMKQESQKVAGHAACRPYTYWDIWWVDPPFPFSSS